MFIDEKELFIKAGKGGDGAVLFRREKFVPRGGPDGGDGGRGGDIFVIGKANLHALSHLAHIEKIVAEDGEKGGHSRSTGKSGESRTIEVPLGTLISYRVKGEWNQLLEITEEGVPVRIAKGGNGGWGNWHFKTSVQQAPDRANAGLPGEEKNLHITLKLIADIGLIGLPNSGKSTLLSVVSAARPKIANYPFTTLEPQLGVATIGAAKDGKQLVIADLPGLIEGASQGKGLGTAFLKHIERTTQIIHCLDGSLSPEELEHNYKAIRQELSQWSEELAKKPELIALTKIDLLSEEEVAEKKSLLAQVSKQPVFPISAVTHKGLVELLTAYAQ